MNSIYVSKPFTIENGSDVSISPIEITNKNRKTNSVTTGVLLKNSIPAENYILKIYKVTKSNKQTFIGFTFTDSFGQFTIPINPKGTMYLIKVYSLKEELEDIELIINE